MKKAPVFTTMAITIAMAALGSETFVCPRLSYSVSNAVSAHPGALQPGFAPRLGVVFTESDLSLRIDLTADPELRDEVTSGRSALRVNDPWWKDLTITLTPLNRSESPAAEPLTLTSRDLQIARSHFFRPDAESKRLLEREKTNRLDLSEVATVDILIPPIPAGDYSVRLSLGDQSDCTGGVLATYPDLLASREGNENLPLQRMFLTERRKDTTTFEEYRDIQMKLIKLEPNAWGLWEDLGNVSLGERPPAETFSYYERALEIAARVGAGENEPSTYRGQRPRLFRQLYPLYVREYDRLKLAPASYDGTATFQWVDRRTGQVLGYVDPSRPGLPTAVESPK